MRKWYKNVAPPELKGRNNILLQECRSSGAQRQEQHIATRMSLLQSSKAGMSICYKNIAPPELNGNSTILYSSSGGAEFL